jgi:hypothetical protein
MDIMKYNGIQNAGWCFGTFFPHILGIIIPTDELIFFRGVGQPPTRNVICQDIS